MDNSKRLFQNYIKQNLEYFDAYKISNYTLEKILYGKDGKSVIYDFHTIILRIDGTLAVSVGYYSKSKTTSAGFRQIKTTSKGNYITESGRRIYLNTFTRVPNK